jgi:hypothetical protein
MGRWSDRLKGKPFIALSFSLSQISDISNQGEERYNQRTFPQTCDFTCERKYIHE